MLYGFNEHPKDKMSLCFSQKYISTGVFCSLRSPFSLYSMRLKKSHSTNNCLTFFNVRWLLSVLYTPSQHDHTCDQVILSMDAEKAFDQVELSPQDFN